MTADLQPRFQVPPSSPRVSGMRIRIDLSYDGTDYAGWQIQPDRPSVQARLEEALHRLTGETIRAHSSGRTDAGVHAYGQVVHADLLTIREPDRLTIGLNALLPPDIRVWRVRRASPSFHARFSATEKEYRYRVWNNEIMNPCFRLYRAHERRPLKVEAMQKAAQHLEGRHDFAAFSANPNRDRSGDTVRTLRTLRVHRRGPDVTITARGDGFLYRMVRSLAGFLLRVGTGELEPETAPSILVSRIRTARVPTAPPQGLFLWKVFYGRRKTVTRLPNRSIPKQTERRGL